MWPPELDALKDDLKIAPTDTRDDDRLETMLAAAISFVEDVRSGDFDFGDGPDTLPVPSPTLELGTIRLAARWHQRRRSPDGLIQMGDLGTARVTSYDVDIDRQLGIGKFRKSVIA